MESATLPDSTPTPGHAFTPAKARAARRVRSNKDLATKQATPTVVPEDVKDLCTVSPRQFKTLSETDKDKLLLTIRDCLLLTTGQEMLRKTLIRGQKLTTQDTIPYGTLYDKRYKERETGSQALKAPTFFVQSLQIAILQAPTTTISSVDVPGEGEKTCPQVEKSTGCDES